MLSYIQTAVWKAVFKHTTVLERLDTVIGCYVYTQAHPTLQKGLKTMLQNQKKPEILI